MKRGWGFRRTAAACGLVLAVLTGGVAEASVTMTVTPTTSVSWTLASTGSNTRSAGSMTVSATQAYSVTVTADRTRLTEWITASSAYASSPKMLAAPLKVLTALSSGAGVPIASVDAATSAQTIATGVGTALTPATDTYALTLSQTTAITDPALPSGRKYHVVLTYTASATL